jgi:hypothetical protein
MTVSGNRMTWYSSPLFQSKSHYFYKKADTKFISPHVHRRTCVRWQLETTDKVTFVFFFRSAALKNPIWQPYLHCTPTTTLFFLLIQGGKTDSVDLNWGENDVCVKVMHDIVMTISVSFVYNFGKCYGNQFSKVVVVINVYSIERDLWINSKHQIYHIAGLWRNRSLSKISFCNQFLAELVLLKEIFIFQANRTCCAVVI